MGVKMQEELQLLEIKLCLPTVVSRKSIGIAKKRAKGKLKTTNDKN
jgi:hypothetical protein